MSMDVRCIWYPGPQIPSLISATAPALPTPFNSRMASVFQAPALPGLP